MKNINSLDPQLNLLFQAYILGIILSHLPFLFGNVALITFAFKAIASLPFFGFTYFFYKKYYRNVHLNPIFYSAFVFFGINILSLFLALSLNKFNELNAKGIVVILLLVSPPALISCFYFAFMLKRRLDDKMLCNVPEG